MYIKLYRIKLLSLLLLLQYKRRLIYFYFFITIQFYIIKNISTGNIQLPEKFGNITGKMDVDLIGLQMENWQPLSFDARVLSSPGSYQKRISQKAVPDICSMKPPR